LQNSAYRFAFTSFNANGFTSLRVIASQFNSSKVLRGVELEFAWEDDVTAVLLSCELELVVAFGEGIMEESMLLSIFFDPMWLFDPPATLNPILNINVSSNTIFNTSPFRNVNVKFTILLLPDVVIFDFVGYIHLIHTVLKGTGRNS